MLVKIKQFFCSHDFVSSGIRGNGLNKYVDHRCTKCGQNSKEYV
ncbi:hypothetical protein IGI72_003671 [Enterococcus sp. DIV1059_2]